MIKKVKFKYKPEPNEKASSNKKAQSNKKGKSIGIKDWFYMNTEELTTVEIYEKCKDSKEFRMEAWHDAGVIEITPEEGHSIDMEKAPLDLGEDYSNQYLQMHNIKTLFYVTIAPDFYEEAEPVMKAVTKQLGGFFCGDTEDFNPVVK